MIAVMRKILLNALMLLFSPFPRNRHLWVTGKISSWEFTNAPPAFFDNAKYFFLYLIHHTDEKVYWLSSSDSEIAKLRSMHLPVVRFPSLMGIWLVLRARFSFHHYGVDQINEILQRGSVQMNFWHGTPIKMIMYDVVEKVPEKPRIWSVWEKRDGVEYISSTSEFLSSNVLMRAFDVSKDQLLNFGYPRTDVMRLNKNESLKFCERYSPELLRDIQEAVKYDRVFLYMPTYRDDDMAYFEKASIDFEAMSRKLREINGVFFLKLHPLTKYSTVKEYDNIIQISNDVDIYPFLVYTDFLVTDYSSILFDYLLLDKEIIFIPYDYENYVSHRKLYYEYEEITPGIKYQSFRDFIENLTRVDELDYKKERERVRNLFIQDYNFDACEKTYQFMKEHFQS